MSDKDNLHGAGLMAAAMALFASQDVLIKAITATIPMGQMMAVVGVVGAAVFALIALRKGHSPVARSFFHPVILARNGGEMFGTTCFIIGLSILPLGLMSALLQANPLFVNLGAILFLGMSVGWRRWVAIFLGLVGVLIILRPGLDGFRIEALLGLGTAVGLAVRDVATRMQPAHVHPLQTSVWGFGVVALSGVGLMIWGEGPVWPNGVETLLLAGATALGMIGYYALTRAMQTGDVPSVTPFRYTRLLFAILFAYFIFGEVPDRLTLLGAALIIGAGVFTVLREARMMRHSARARAGLE